MSAPQFLSYLVALQHPQKRDWIKVHARGPSHIGVYPIHRSSPALDAAVFFTHQRVSGKINPSCCIGAATICTHRRVWMKYESRRVCCIGAAMFSTAVRRPNITGALHRCSGVLYTSACIGQKITQCIGAACSYRTSHNSALFRRDIVRIGMRFAIAVSLALRAALMAQIEDLIQAT